MRDARYGMFELLDKILMNYIHAIFRHQCSFILGI